MAKEMNEKRIIKIYMYYSQMNDSEVKMQLKW